MCNEHLEPLPETLVSTYKDVQLKCYKSTQASDVFDDLFSGPDDFCHSASIQSIPSITPTYEEMKLLIGTGDNDMVPSSTLNFFEQSETPDYNVGDMAPLSSAVVEKYMCSICTYASRLRSKEKTKLAKEKQKRKVKGDKLFPDAEKVDDDTASEESLKRGRRSRSSSPQQKRPDEQGGIRERSPIDTSISCCFVSAAKFNDLDAYDSDKETDNVRKERRETDAFNILDDLGLARNKDTRTDEEKGFMGLDYFFVPYNDAGMGHHYLLGIAPKQKYLFALESMNHAVLFKEQPIKGIYLLALVQIPREQLDRDWPIYGRWTKKDDKLPDGSPQAVWQMDVHSKYLTGPDLKRTIC